jgi:hypothetical protein
LELLEKGCLRHSYMPAPQHPPQLLERLESYNTVVRFALEKPESKVLTRGFVCNVSLVLIVLPAVLLIVVELTDADDNFYNSTPTLPHISTKNSPYTTYPALLQC